MLEQQQPLCATLLELRKADLMPSDTEFSTLETFVSVMKPLVEITEAIGGEQWITISTVRPLLHKLMKSHLVPSASDNSLTRTIKTTLLTDLENRYADELLKFLTKATLLDPRFKSLKFLSQEERKEVIFELEDDVDLIVADVRDDELTATKPKKGKLMSILEDIREGEEDCLPPLKERLAVEISRYIGEQPTDKTPIDWWKQNQDRYPLLSQLAKRYLAIPATSVPCERVFSSAGYIVSERRSCLLPENVSKLVFLAENLR